MREDANPKFNITPRRPINLEGFVDFYDGMDAQKAYASAPFSQCISFKAERTWIGKKVWSNNFLKKAVITELSFYWPSFNVKDASTTVEKSLNFNICIREYAGSVNDQNWTLRFQKNLLNCKREGEDEIRVDPPVELKSGSTFCVIVEDQSTIMVKGIPVPAGRHVCEFVKADVNPEVSLELDDVAVTLKGIKKNDKFFGLQYPKDSEPVDVIVGITICLV